MLQSSTNTENHQNQDEIQSTEDRFPSYNQNSKIFKYKCTYSATVTDTLKRRGWIEVNNSDDWDIYFCDLNQFRDVFSGQCRSLQEHQKVAHFRNAFEIARKNLMVKNLKRLRYRIEKAFGRVEAEKCNFYPTTFALPAEQPLFLNEFRKNPGTLWIIKPSAGAQGKGIFIFQKLKEYFEWRSKTESISVTSKLWEAQPMMLDSVTGRSKSEANVDSPKTDKSDSVDLSTQSLEMQKNDGTVKHEIYVVQRYIMNPYLIGGKKFDIRFFVLVTSYNPLVAWVYREGFARFSGGKRIESAFHNGRTITRLKRVLSSTGQFSLNTIHDMFLHLTNVAIQRMSEEYNPQQGSKWSLRHLREYLTSRHGRDVVVNLMNSIDNIIIRTLQSVQFHIIQDPHCFEIYGFDVIIDDNVRPWLLEVNAAPAFTPSNEEDYRLKCSLIDDTMHVLDLEKRLTGLEKRIGGFDLIWKNGPVYANPEDCCYCNAGEDGAKLNSYLGCQNDRQVQLREILANAKLVIELQKSYGMDIPLSDEDMNLEESIMKSYSTSSPSSDMATAKDNRFRLPTQTTLHHPRVIGTGLNFDLLSSTATSAKRKTVSATLRSKSGKVDKFILTGKPVEFRKNMLDFIKYLDRSK